MVVDKLRKLVPVISKFPRFMRMAESIMPDVAESQKRNLDLEQKESEESQAKKAKVETQAETKQKDGLPHKKKKVALMMMYNGKNYYGMQRNPGMNTIEKDLMEALLKAGVITKEHAKCPEKMSFQRGARTDKAVSAAGQLCSLKMFIDVEDSVTKINSYLPPDIRILGIKQTTKGFCCKNAASARTYLYFLPTFAFCPVTETITEDYRITDDVLNKVNNTLSLFKGTHNFHNYTSGKKPTDPSARRYIMEMSMGKPFEKEGIEFAVITVKGQSFMLHQIRKIIGVTIPVVQGLTDESFIQLSWGPERVDVPRCPGLGLMLDRLHYDWYNKKFGSDGTREALDFDSYKKEIDEFKDEVIFKSMIETEKQEKSMMTWLQTLHLHNYQTKTSDGPPLKTGVALAYRDVKDVKRKAQEAESESKGPGVVVESESKGSGAVAESESKGPDAESKSKVAEKVAESESKVAETVAESESKGPDAAIESESKGSDAVVETETKSETDAKNEAEIIIAEGEKQ